MRRALRCQIWTLSVIHVSCCQDHTWETEPRSMEGWQFYFILLSLSKWSFTLSILLKRIKIKITETSQKRIINLNTKSPKAAATFERQIRVLVHCIVVYWACVCVACTCVYRVQKSSLGEGLWLDLRWENGICVPRFPSPKAAPSYCTVCCLWQELTPYLRLP